MRRLIPEPADLHLDELYLDLVLADTVGEGSTQRSAVALGVVSSIDGAVTVDGTSNRLGADADRVAFRRLRDACDAILVGAGTVRAERYRPPEPGAARRAARVGRGLAPAPRLVIVSSSLDLSPQDQVFGDPSHRPLVVTHDRASDDAAAALAQVAEVARFGTGGHIDLAAVLAALARRGLGRVLCEGGPRLAGTLLAQDLIDEVFVTVSPQLVGGSAGRVIAGDAEALRDLRLVSVHEHEGELLLRYTRAGAGEGSGGWPPTER